MISWQLTAALALLVFVASAFPSDIANDCAVAATAEQQAGANVGDAAPEFQLQQMNGPTISLVDLRGHPAVIIFWTSWCPICKAEAPEFNRLMRRHRASGISVLGINIQESEKRTRAGMKDFGIRYRVVRDADASVAQRYQVTATPTVIFLDAEGVIKYKGTRLPEDYDRQLMALFMQGQ